MCPSPNDLRQVPRRPWTKNSTIIAGRRDEPVRVGWLPVCFPALSAKPRKKLEPSARKAAWACLHRWRDEAVKAGRQNHAGLHWPFRSWSGRLLVWRAG